MKKMSIAESVESLVQECSLLVGEQASTVDSMKLDPCACFTQFSMTLGRVLLEPNPDASAVDNAFKLLNTLAKEGDSEVINALSSIVFPELVSDPHVIDLCQQKLSSNARCLFDDALKRSKSERTFVLSESSDSACKRAVKLLFENLPEYYHYLTEHWEEDPLKEDQPYIIYGTLVSFVEEAASRLENMRELVAQMCGIINAVASWRHPATDDMLRCEVFEALACSEILKSQVSKFLSVRAYAMLKDH